MAYVGALFAFDDSLRPVMNERSGATTGFRLRLTGFGNLNVL